MYFTFVTDIEMIARLTPCPSTITGASSQPERNEFQTIPTCSCDQIVLAPRWFAGDHVRDAKCFAHQPEDLRENFLVGISIIGNQ